MCVDSVGLVEEAVVMPRSSNVVFFLLNSLISSV